MAFDSIWHSLRYTGMTNHQTISHLFYLMPWPNFKNLESWILDLEGGKDSSVGKSSAPPAGDPGSNPGGSLTRVTQCMNERGRDYKL